MSLRVHFDFISFPLRCHFDFTSISLRFHCHFDFTSSSLRFHFGFTSISLRFHFDITSISHGEKETPCHTREKGKPGGTNGKRERASPRLQSPPNLRYIYIYIYIYISAARNPKHRIFVIWEDEETSIRRHLGRGTWEDASGKKYAEEVSGRRLLG